MGFWQGLYAAQSAEMERNAVAAENEKSRAYDREKFQEQLKEGYRDNLFALALKRGESTALSGEVRAKAQSLLSRLEGVDDPRVGALRDNPAAAAQLEDQLHAMEIKAQGSDVNLPPLSGMDLLDMTTIILPDSGEVKVVDVSLEDIAGVSSRDEYERMASELSTPTGGGGYVTLKPKAYRIPDPKNLEEGRKLFDQEVLRAANEELARVAGDVGASATLESLIANYGKEGGAERFQLRELFGPQAWMKLATLDSPYVRNLKDDAQLSPYLPKVISGNEEHAALPSDSYFIGPDKKLRRKP